MKKILITVSIFLISVFFGICLFIISFALYNQYKIIKQVPVKHTLFSVDKAPTLSVDATIASLSGSVMWQSRTATEPAQIYTTRKIQQGENVSTNEQGLVSLIYPNESTIFLFPNSELDIIQTLPVNFVFEQKSGSIHYHSNSSIPFSVRVEHILLVFTQSDLKITLDSNLHIVTISIISGNAKAAFNTLDYVSTINSLSQGDLMVFHDDTRETQIKPGK